MPPRAVRPPAETTSLVGRKAELAMLSALLTASRMVTVTGPGGVGKTRLALSAAATARPAYTDGVVLADLSALRDPELLPQTVAAALRLPRPGGVPLLEAIMRHLRDARMLLILDTCEHLLDAAALFTEAVLRFAPGVTILATSRQPLDVVGENTCPLGPLPVPTDAVELFTERAGDAVTAQNRPDVLRICERLDGIPLALERAAARVRESGVLGDPGPADLGLTDVIGWSYDLCTPAEQVLWARLSVFDGPLTVSAAEEVCADRELPRGEVLDTLISLVDRSVVTRTDAGRYRMLATIREYGAGRLAASPGEQDRVRGRLLHRYLRLAEEFDADPLTRQLSRYQALRAEHASIRAALRHGFAIHGGRAAAARLVTALYWYWHFSGLVGEAEHWIALTLEQSGDECAERAGALMLRGLAVSARGGAAAGVRDCEAGLAMAQAVGDTRLHARGHLYYCQALLAAGREQEALTAGRAAASLMPAAGDGRAAELLHVYLGLANLAAGHIGQALDLAARGLSRLPGDGEERWAGSVLYAVTGLGLFLTGQTAHGCAALRKSLTAGRALGDPAGLIAGLTALGFAAAGQGRHARAAWLLGAARPLRERAEGGTFTGGTFMGGTLMTVSGLSRLTGDAARDARDVLGDHAYGQLVTAGARCPLEEALDVAVSDSDPPALAGASPSPSQPAGPRPAAAVPGPRSAGSADTGAADASSPLTERQLQIAALAAAGLSNREIAEHLVISKRTVDTHVTHIFAKLGVTSRTQLSRWFYCPS